MIEKLDKQLNSKGDRRGMSHNSQNNLHPRLKGNNHASKNYSITRIIKEMLDQPATERWLEVEDKGRELTWRQAIAKRILIEAIRGNARLISELLDRVDGKVIQPIETLGILEIKDTRELTDEQLAIIAATNIVKNHAFRGSNRTSEEAASS